MQRRPLIDEVVFDLPLWERLKRHLVRVPEDSDEQLAFLLASPSKGIARQRLLVREAIFAGADDFERQGPGGLEPKPAFVITAINRCSAEGWSLIEVHSHPFSSGSGTTFSGIDWNNDRAKFPRVARFLDRNALHATMVVGQNSLDIHVYDRETSEIVPINTVTIVGFDVENRRARLLHIPATGTTQRDQSESRLSPRYDRHSAIFGQAGQQRLREAVVAVVGVGGIGAFVALELAHLGIGRLILIDPDRVEQSNLNRLIGAGESDIGALKVEVIARLARAIQPELRVNVVSGSIIDPESLEIVKDADIIAGCVDNHGARLILNQLALRQLIPLVDAGTGIRPADRENSLVAGGQVQLVLPGSGCLECRGFIDTQRASHDLASPMLQEENRARGYGIDEPAPSVIFLNGVIASMQVAEMVYLLTDGALSGLPTSLAYVMYNATARSMMAASPSSSDSCVSCGQDGVVGVGDLGPLKAATDRQTSSIPDAAPAAHDHDNDHEHEESVATVSREVIRDTKESQTPRTLQVPSKPVRPSLFRRLLSSLRQIVRPRQKRPVESQAETNARVEHDLNEVNHDTEASDTISTPVEVVEVKPE